MSTFTYPATMTVDTAGFSLVTFPDVPEAGTDAETYEEALCAAPDALLAALGGYIAARRPIPPPRRLTRARSRWPYRCSWWPSWPLNSAPSSSADRELRAATSLELAMRLKGEAGLVLPLGSPLDGHFLFVANVAPSRCASSAVERVSMSASRTLSGVGRVLELAEFPAPRTPRDRPPRPGCAPAKADRIY